MSIESPIGEDKNWFAGETRVLQFDVENGYGAEDWTFRFRLFPRQDDTPLFTKVNGPITAEEADEDGIAVVNVVVVAEDTEGLEGSYHFDLWRTDVGQESVLSYGSAIIRNSATAS